MKRILNYAWMLTAASLLALTACKSGKPSEEGHKRAIRQIMNAYEEREYQELLTLADSLHTIGELSEPEAYYWQGYACDRTNQLRMAEFYWKTAITQTENSTTPEELALYAKSASRLANLLGSRGEYSAVFYLREKYKLLDHGDFWLSDTPDEPSYGPGASYRRICTWALLQNKETGETYAHVNTHLDNGSNEAREAGARQIVDFIESNFADTPVVFTADMNTGEGSTAYNNFIEVAAECIDHLLAYLLPDFLVYYRHVEQQPHAVVLYLREHLLLDNLLNDKRDRYDYSGFDVRKSLCDDSR